MSQVDAWSTPGNKGIIEASATCAREMARFLVQRLTNDPPNGANWTASCPPALDLPAPTAGTTSPIGGDDRADRPAGRENRR